MRLSAVKARVSGLRPILLLALVMGMIAAMTTTLRFW